MAFKITLNTAEDVTDFLDMLFVSHRYLSNETEDMVNYHNAKIHQELERREYRINREKHVLEQEQLIEKSKKVK